MSIDTPPTDAPPVDSLLLVGFGGPEGPADVLPSAGDLTPAKARIELLLRLLATR